MKLSELKRLVDQATEKAAKHRVDPQVLLVDFRYNDGRPAPIHEEARPLVETFTFCGEALHSVCIELHWDESELNLIGNHPYFCLTADDTKGIL